MMSLFWSDYSNSTVEWKSIILFINYTQTKLDREETNIYLEHLYFS